MSDAYNFGMAAPDSLGGLLGPSPQSMGGLLTAPPQQYQAPAPQAVSAPPTVDRAVMNPVAAVLDNLLLHGAVRNALDTNRQARLENLSLIHI